VSRSGRVSVVVPVYNGEAYIRSCIEALFAQTVPVDEILVMNDGSTDGTESVVRQFDTSIVQQVVLAHQGVVAARSTGIRKATGDFVGFCDADDRWLPSKLEKQMDVIKDADLVHTNTFIVRGGRRVGDWYAEENVHPMSGTGANLLPFLFDRNQINGSSVLVRRDILLRALAVPIDPAQCLDIDYPLWLYLLEIGARFKAISEPLVERYMHEGQMTEKHYLNKRFQEYTLRTFLLRNPSFIKQHPWLVRKKFVKTLIKMAIERKRELGRPFPVGGLTAILLETLVRGWPRHSFEEQVGNSV